MDHEQKRGLSNARFLHAEECLKEAKALLEIGSYIGQNVRYSIGKGGGLYEPRQHCEVEGHLSYLAGGGKEVS